MKVLYSFLPLMPYLKNSMDILRSMAGRRHEILYTGRGTEEFGVTIPLTD